MNKAIGPDGHEINGRIGNPPGEFIREEMEERALTQTALAKALGIKQSNLSDVIKGKRRINAPLALQLERLWGVSAEFWLGLQSRFDLALERERLFEMHE